MYAFPIFGALLHGTALAVLSFFVLFAASKAEGRIKSYGLFLGSWLAILALVAVVGMTVMHGNGMRSFQGMGNGMMQGTGPSLMHGTDGAQPDTTKP